MAVPGAMVAAGASTSVMEISTCDPFFALAPVLELETLTPSVQDICFARMLAAAWGSSGTAHFCRVCGFDEDDEPEDGDGCAGSVIDISAVLWRVLGQFVLDVSDVSTSGGRMEVRGRATSLRAPGPYPPKAFSTADWTSISLSNWK